MDSLKLYLKRELKVSPDSLLTINIHGLHRPLDARTYFRLGWLLLHEQVFTLGHISHWIICLIDMDTELDKNNLQQFFEDEA